MKAPVPNGYAAKYQAVLVAAGMPLDSFNPGSSEYALNRGTAIQAIEGLQGTSHAVVGGDVVIIAEGGLRYIDNWFVERKPAEPEASFAQRSRDYALRYIEEFTPPGDWEPLFVLVTTELR